ncbi:hypothetical protein BSZ19_12805 [Bradyrhizobium japonicum]|uniref:Uncharacterized protein n=1 Tax=Bradyrhizobium japonicum TaxID=375 RepID=A0A1Y2JUB5_BRAJP|nr:hypothetical protein [Bradyrhizobium japonicum]OSJ34217.1 hypothetical protein BSZ19_12805 [Bradyrhizobium japonicum]
MSLPEIDEIERLSPVGDTANWVLVTDEIADRLHVGYCLWIDALTEIRRRMEYLRDQHRVGWNPSAELQQRLDDLNERDEVYAAHHMDTARAFLDAADGDINATLQERTNRRTKLIGAIVQLRHAWENGWQTADEWTPEERNELTWLMYCNPEMKSLYRIAEQNTLYFVAKLEALRAKTDREAPALPGRNPYRKTGGGNPYRAKAFNPYRRKH